MKIPLRPEGKPCHCWGSVEAKIRKEGGEAVTGWLPYTPDEKGESQIIGYNPHVVWKSPEGELIDITPQLKYNSNGQHVVHAPEEMEFIPDETVTPWTRIRYEAIDKRLSRLAEFLNASEATEDREKHLYWTKRANEIAHKHALHFPERSEHDWRAIALQKMFPEMDANNPIMLRTRPVAA